MTSFLMVLELHVASCTQMTDSCESGDEGYIIQGLKLWICSQEKEENTPETMDHQTVSHRHWIL